MRQISACCIARRIVKVEAKSCTGREFHGSVGKGTDAQFRPLQVRKDTDRSRSLALDAANYLKSLLMLIVCAVAEVQPEHVDTCIEKLANHVDTRTRRS